LRFRVSPTLRIATGLLLAVLLGVVGYHVLRWRIPGSSEALLEQADEKSWVNNWIAAEPLYRQAELGFIRKHEPSKALYAHVSEIPAESESSISVPAQLAELTADLSLPQAQAPETRLRILTILGMLEVNYDSAMARATWAQVEALARQRHHYLLASRAIGEQGIAAFLLGDIATAKKNVVKAWTVAKVADPAAHIRYASVYGTGLVELQKYGEALGPLDEAIKVSKDKPDVAYPTIAINAKVEALSGLGRNQEALALASEAMQRASNYHLAGHLYELYQARASVYGRMGQWDRATDDYARAIQFAKQLSYWRGMTQADGLLAKAYFQRGQLQPALAAVNGAIEANKQIPDELYFVPRDLAIKAEILAKLGDAKSSDELYRKSTDLIDALLSKVPTPTVERQLLGQLSEVYAGYFASLSNRGKNREAFGAIERARGRVEAQALEDHEPVAPHEPTTAEKLLTNLNVRLLDTDDVGSRQNILQTIYDTEQQINPNFRPDHFSTEPVDLDEMQRDLGPSELMLEYVLDEPNSYVLAISKTEVKRYTLKAKSELEREAADYRSEVMKQKVDDGLARRLFDDLVKPVSIYSRAQSIIVVPDGKLHLLPFSALSDGGQYVLTSHLVTVVPSGTVFHILRHREQHLAVEPLPYLGVAAWTINKPKKTLFSGILRGASGPERSELIALPESRHEVESIASDLPKPDTVLLGSAATETQFKHLPLSQFNVLHLALHGYADMEYSDRSALVFAPEEHGPDDGLLQIREIRSLPLKANLVTLSACDTGVGPVGEEGVANIVNAFVEAGAQTVVSTLWELEDHAAAHLMTVFYEHLGRAEEKGQSLREAQLQMIASGDPPYFWAGFEVVGDPTGSLFNNSNLNSTRRRNQ
jgi:CHAT domain-containing protein